MSSNRTLPRGACVTLFTTAALWSLTGTATLAAQPAPRQPRTAERPAYDATLYSDGTKTNRAFKSLKWRLVGPFRGGRSTAVTGDPTRPLVFYFGAVNGGVWKTTNAGQTWENITDGKTDLSSVGAIAVAPSDPNVVWFGTGETFLRSNVSIGDGIYRSTDAGAHWQRMAWPSRCSRATTIGWRNGCAPRWVCPRARCCWARKCRR